MGQLSKGIQRLGCMLLLVLFATELWAQPSFSWGLRERVRHTYMNNNMDFNPDNDDEQGFFRIRTNLWGDLKLTNNLSARVMLTNEFRPYTIVRPSDKNKEMTFDEIIFDNLYLKYSSGGENPLTVTFGRQNLIYGEGFILLEGGPWDGSRSIYHDAIKISQKLNNTTIDLLGISNPKYDYRLPKVAFFEKNESYLGLPKAHGDQMMNDGLEEALGLYITHKPAQGPSLEGYYFFKTEQPDYVLPTFGPLTSAQQAKLALHTIGGRLVYPFSSLFNVTTEWAYQMGSQADLKQNSYGGYLNLNYTVMPEKKGVGTIGINVLSGDDPETADLEGWNPLFSRWPKWSELYIYSQTLENIDGGRQVAYWTNTIAPNARLVFNLLPNLNVTAWVHHLRAFYSNEALGSGKVRGNELQLWLKLKLTNQLNGHFLYDYFIPGDFYPKPRANAQFIRFELMYTFQSK